MQDKFDKYISEKMQELPIIFSEQDWKDFEKKLLENQSSNKIKNKSNNIKPSLMSLSMVCLGVIFFLVFKKSSIRDSQTKRNKTELVIPSFKDSIVSEKIIPVIITREKTKEIKEEYQKKVSSKSESYTNRPSVMPFEKTENQTETAFEKNNVLIDNEISLSKISDTFNLHGKRIIDTLSLNKKMQKDTLELKLKKKKKSIIW